LKKCARFYVFRFVRVENKVESREFRQDKRRQDEKKQIKREKVKF